MSPTRLPSPKSGVWRTPGVLLRGLRCHHITFLNIDVSSSFSFSVRPVELVRRRRTCTPVQIFTSQNPILPHLYKFIPSSRFLTQEIHLTHSSLIGVHKTGRADSLYTTFTTQPKILRPIPHNQFSKKPLSSQPNQLPNPSKKTQMADSLLPPLHQKASHGRGGAGNIGPTVNDAARPANLATPTIKSPIYTTGRGGSGNMKRNDPKHPELARKSQDVAPVVQRRRGSGSGSGDRGMGTGHTGRGGAANILHPSIDDIMHANSRDENAIIDEGRQYERLRREGRNEPQAGDWWRDEMASGRVRN